jgi:hypothetical protein
MDWQWDSKAHRCMAVWHAPFAGIEASWIIGLACCCSGYQKHYASEFKPHQGEGLLWRAHDADQ